MDAQHRCTDACGITPDRDCPVWQAQSPDGVTRQFRAEFERQDRACRRALRLMVEEPDLVGAILHLLGGEFRVVFADLVEQVSRAAVRDLIVQTLARELPQTLAELGVVREKSLRAVVEECVRLEIAEQMPELVRQCLENPYQ